MWIALFAVVIAFPVWSKSFSYGPGPDCAAALSRFAGPVGATTA